jgi:hypothetical protein
MFLLTREQIMDLIGSILSIENKLGGRKSGQGKGKSAQKNTYPHAADDKNRSSDEQHGEPKDEYRVGRIVDTTA